MHRYHNTFAEPLFWTLGMPVFKILYHRNKAGNSLIFCFLHTFKWAIKLKTMNLREDPVVGTLLKHEA